jgi:hypothetical protein
MVYFPRGIDETRVSVRVGVRALARSEVAEPLSKCTVRDSCLLCNMYCIVQSVCLNRNVAWPVRTV